MNKIGLSAGREKCSVEVMSTDYIPRYYPRDGISTRYPMVAWGPARKNPQDWAGEDWQRRHCVIWAYERGSVLFGVEWYSQTKHPNFPYFSLTLHLPFFRIWYKYEVEP